MSEGRTSDPWAGADVAADGKTPQERRLEQSEQQSSFGEYQYEEDWQEVVLQAVLEIVLSLML